MTNWVLMPPELTAENGAKAAFSGEFFWEEEVSNPEYCGCGRCHYCSMYDEPETIIAKHVVPWTTIKEIYRAAVEKFGED